MITLKEYNKLRFDELREISRHKTNIQCPNCDSELIYISPNTFFVLDNSSFRWATVACDCGYKTNIIIG